MNTRMLRAASALLISLCGCDLRQPPIGCPVQRYTWAARFVLKEGQSATPPCGTKAGERLGMQKYNVPETSENTLVIKPFKLAALDAVDPSEPPYSLGALADAAGPDGFCTAPELSVARKVVPGTGMEIGYAWSQVRILATPDAPGSQMLADLSYTEGGCTAEYEVWAQWPAVSCGDGDGNPSDAICSEPGHALNPEFDSICDPTQLRCVPAKRPPSFR